MNNLDLLRQSLRLARRELRSGLRGFGVFLSCLCLGVFAISAIGSFTSAARSGLLADASALLGGDLEVRRVHLPLKAEEKTFLTARGSLSEILEMRTMAGHPGSKARVLVELKAVDSAYPLYGRIQTDPPQDLADAFSNQGALAERALLERLGIEVGDRLRIGNTDLQLRGVIVSEPDRDVRPFHLGPRLLIDKETLDLSGLLRPGSLVTYRNRLRLPDPSQADLIIEKIKESFPLAGWRLRSWHQAAPRVRNVLDRMGTNLTLLGLTALLIGGLGVSGAVRGYLSGKVVHIAAMKCLGAPGRLIFFSYLFQVLILGALGAGVGLLAGSALPWLLKGWFGDRLPIPLQPSLNPEILFVAALYGLFVALLFSLQPLGVARQVPASVLFRGYVESGQTPPGRSVRIAIVCTGLLLVLLAYFSSDDQRLAGWFIVGASGCFLCFRLFGTGLIRLSRKLPRPTRPWLRLGLANLHRRGSPTGSILFSLGLGMTALVMIALVQSNLNDLVNDQLPEKAPAFFFLDIQTDQVKAFEKLVANLPGTRDLERYPTLRGRITAIKGVPVEQAKIDPRVQWAIRGDRFLSYSGTMPQGAVLTAGDWWSSTGTGKPQISLTADLAKGFHVQIGDTLTVNILGRSITAEIANFRLVDWSTLELNFALLFSPGVLENAPQTHLAALHVNPDAESRVYTAITQQFPNVSAITTRELLKNVSRTLDRLGGAFKAMAALVLMTGLLVLAGAVSADQHRRIHDAVIFKVCGATRWTILLAFGSEFALLGLSSGLLSALVGTLAAMAILKGPMDLPFSAHPEVVFFTLASGIGVTMLLGLLGTWKALGHKPASYLRGE